MAEQCDRCAGKERDADRQEHPLVQPLTDAGILLGAEILGRIVAAVTPRVNIGWVKIISTFEAAVYAATTVERNVTAPVDPTAASTCTPMVRPTIMVSAML